MFYIFKRKKQKKPVEEDANKSKPLPRVSFMHKVQIGFCERMRKYDQLFTNQQKKILFGIYISLFSIYFSIILINVFFRFKNAESDFPNNHRITLPKDITLPDSLNIELLREKRSLKKRLDSIHQYSK